MAVMLPIEKTCSDLVQELIWAQRTNNTEHNMAAQYDLIIRGGTVYDGSGSAGQRADIAVSNGKIAKVGTIDGSAASEIDASGQIVTPGFVDIHSHYDGQVTWTDRLSPSCAHGVTTVVMGNCGVGFAPCRPDDRNMLIKLMEGVEDIPNVVLNEGLPWNWETLPEFLDSVDGKHYDIDFAAQVTHAPLRVYVMGERGANREAATDAEISEMGRLAREGIEAGALGFSTSRTLNHRSSDGRPTPTLTASEQELVGIAKALGETGQGVLQVVSDFRDPEAEWALMRTMAQQSGRPLSLSLAQSDKAPKHYQTILAELERANAEGLSMRAQVGTRAVGIVMGLETTVNPLVKSDSYQRCCEQPLAQRLQQLRQPQLRAQIIEELTDSTVDKVPMINAYDKLYILGSSPNYEQHPDQSIAAIAAANNRHPVTVIIDAMLDDGGKGMLYIAFLNYANGNLDSTLEMLKHPHTVPGLSDGGAHVGLICDASFPTTLLTHWTRDRSRGDKLSIEYAVKCYSKDSAEAVGLQDRGLLAPGYRADINVIDYDNLRLHSPGVVYDLPAGGKRLNQLADGYSVTIVNGEVTYQNGVATGALPGRLIRGAKQSPA